MSSLLSQSPISRRGVIGAPILLAGCRKRSDYFGNTTPPQRRVLKFALGPEPDGLDPSAYATGFELYILPSLFEGLVSYDPYTVEPAAALATHFETNSDDSRFTFFLRGHPNPRGIQMPGGARTEVARWTDGAPITAHDFVYSWRRVIDPATAAFFAYVLYYVQNGKDIQQGRKRVEQLGVRALDDFTFQVELDRPSPLFLKLAGSFALSAVPRQAIEAARRRGSESNWVQPGNIVSSGAFRLKEWRPYDRIVLERNPRYYDADLVSLDEVHFLSVADVSTIVELYEAGEVHTMPGERIPAQFSSALEGKRDFCVAPAVFSVWVNMNVTRAPCDDPLVRYAINMAIDKRRFAEVLRANRLPAKGLVPPMPGFSTPENVTVDIAGRKLNVLEYNPEAARALFAASRYASLGRLKLRYLSASLPLSSIISMMLRQQLQAVLGAEMLIDVQELNVANRTEADLAYEGLSDGGDWGTYVDPGYFLDKYLIGSRNNSTGWQDTRYDAMVADAHSTVDSAERLRKQQECERYLLRDMPLLPLWYNTWSYLQKPFVRGLPANLLDLRLFKYAAIDTNWRPTV
jgi:ABC-type oligopeptide transport system substrate-binding subunit